MSLKKNAQKDIFYSFLLSIIIGVIGMSKLLCKVCTVKFTWQPIQFFNYYIVRTYLIQKVLILEVSFVINYRQIKETAGF